MTSTTYRFVLDSHAWVEYFRGTFAGEKVKQIIENGTCFTPTIAIAEISAKYAKENYGFWKNDLQFILENSTPIQLTTEIAETAGRLKNAVRKKYKNNFGLADAVILATARTIKSVVVTGDHHFKPFKNVEFIE
ncbi:MAG: DUF4411 family protein [Candidatus Diapherotrites archaeon]|nr:DUF4411 family protein [Candidatus Diapherotrites archaeon]